MVVREVVRLHLLNLLEPDAQIKISDPYENLTDQDKALFTELSQGTLREWFFLEWVVKKLVPKKPRLNLKLTIMVGAYQLLFLDRVPEYAVFSEAKAVLKNLNASEAEIKFVHGVLKNISRQKAEFLNENEKSPLLNFPKELIDVLGGDERAEKSLIAMKKKLEIEKFRLPFSDREQYWIQGKASQHACKIAAEKIKEFSIQTVLEAASGKGGKCLGTLSTLTQIYGEDSKKLPKIKWICTDISKNQKQLFEKNVKPILKELWPQVEVIYELHDWTKASLKIEEKIDFIWLDAPCTGFGTLGKLPEIAVTRGPIALKAAKEMAQVQKSFIQNISVLLPKNFFYTVCTMTPFETDEILSFSQEKLSDMPTNYNVLVKETLWPGFPPLPQAEGFFLFWMQRNSAS